MKTLSPGERLQITVDITSAGQNTVSIDVKAGCRSYLTVMNIENDYDSKHIIRELIKHAVGIAIEQE